MVGSTYGRFYIKFLQNEKTGERHRLSGAYFYFFIILLLLLESNNSKLN